MLYEDTFIGYRNKLKGRLYGVLCEYEKNGNWEKFLDSILTELKGLEPSCINDWAILSKLQALKPISYEKFKNTIFECMNLIGEFKENELS